MTHECDSMSDAGHAEREGGKNRCKGNLDKMKARFFSRLLRERYVARDMLCPYRLWASYLQHKPFRPVSTPSKATHPSSSHSTTPRIQPSKRFLLFHERCTGTFQPLFCHSTSKSPYPTGSPSMAFTCFCQGLRRTFHTKARRSACAQEHGTP